MERGGRADYVAMAPRRECSSISSRRSQVSEKSCCAQHPRTWDQGDVSITDVFIHDTRARPWLQVLGSPSWHNLVVEASVSNPQGCTEMLQPNRSAWKGASGLSVKCNYSQ